MLGAVFISDVPSASRRLCAGAVFILDVCLRLLGGCVLGGAVFIFITKGS